MSQPRQSDKRPNSRQQALGSNQSLTTIFRVTHPLNGLGPLNAQSKSQTLMHKIALHHANTLAIARDSIDPKQRFYRSHCLSMDDLVWWFGAFWTELRMKGYMVAELEGIETAFGEREILFDVKKAECKNVSFRLEP